LTPAEIVGLMPAFVQGAPSMDLHLVTVETSQQDMLVAATRNALNRAILREGQLDPGVLSIPGMSGRQYRVFINDLVRAVADARYLEVGVWTGSTLCAAIFENEVQALAIDNWSQFGGPYPDFFSNLARFKNAQSRVSFLECDFRDVNFHGIGRFNIYFFDGPHDSKSQCDGIVLAQPALDDRFILIVDDWNWRYVRDGTLEGMRRSKLTSKRSARTPGHAAAR
jgi:hypothetical protein